MFCTEKELLTRNGRCEKLHGGCAASAGPWETSGSPQGGRGKGRQDGDAGLGYGPAKWLEGRHGGCDRKEVWSQIAEGLVSRVKKFEGRIIMVATRRRGCHRECHPMESNLLFSSCKAWDDNDYFIGLFIVTNK